MTRACGGAHALWPGEARRPSEVLADALAEVLARNDRLAPLCGVHLGSDRIELHVPPGDDCERARVVAAGADLAAVARAIRRRARGVAIERLPEGDGSSLVARLRVGEPGRPAAARATFTELDTSGRALAAELIAEHEWGLDTGHVPSYLAPFALRRSAWVAEAAARDRARLAAADTVGAIVTPGDGRPDWLAAGEAFDALRAGAGPTVQVIGHPLPPSPSRARLAQCLPGVPQLLVAVDLSGAGASA